MSLATMRRLGALLWLATTARAICHDATVTALTGRLNLATYIEGGLDAGDKCTYAIKPSSSSSMQTLVLVFEELQCDGEVSLCPGLAASPPRRCRATPLATLFCFHDSYFFCIGIGI